MELTKNSKAEVMQPGVKGVEAETDPENEKSKRVLFKCGFLPTGEVGKEGPRFALEKN